MADVNLDRVLSRIDTHEDARNKKEVGELKTIGEKLDLLNMTLLDIDVNLGRIAQALKTREDDEQNTNQLSVTEAFGDFFKNLEERHD